MTKKEKELHDLTKQREDQILYRVFSWLGMSVLLEIIVLLINRYYFQNSPIGTEATFVQSLHRLLSAMEIIGVLLGICCVFWAMFDKRRGKKLGGFRFILSGFFVSLSIVSALALHIGGSCIPILLVGIPALAGLAMVYYLYQREFLLVSFCSVLGILGTWLVRRLGEEDSAFLYGYVIFALCVIMGICLIARYLQNNQGMWQRGEKRMELMAADANYLAIFSSGLLIALALLAALFLGATFAYYALLSLVAWIFIMAVYFTSKLM